MPRVLVVDDDPLMIKLIERVLQDAGCKVVTASGMAEALAAIDRHPIDVAVIDLILGDENGLDLVAAWRDRPDMALIVISTKAHAIDRVVGIEMGADDYLIKPFEPRELAARVRRVFKRLKPPAAALASSSAPPAGDANILRFDSWAVDCDACTLSTADGDKVPLTSTEFRLVEIFATRPNRVLSREQLLELLYGHATPSSDRAVDVMITKIRQKMADAGAADPLIRTVRGLGYQWTAGPP